MNPTRTCIICRKKANKKELIRIVSNAEGNAVWDKAQNLNARGIYFCKDKNCLGKCEKLISKHKLKLKIPVSQEDLIQKISQISNELGESCWEK